MSAVRALALLALAAGACGPAATSSTGSPPPAAPTARAGRACAHEATVPVPASCVRSSARGKLLKDDHDAGLRIWQACERGLVVDGAYVGERVGNGRETADELDALQKAHTKEIWSLDVTNAGLGACGGDLGVAPHGDDTDAGCILLTFQATNEDVPAVAAALVHILAGPRSAEGDVCIPFLIATGVGPVEKR